VSRLLKYPPITSGRDVTMKRHRMVQRGFNMVVDGKCGPKSKAASIEFQRQQGRVEEGSAGPITWAATFAP
jgi:peptidoglycan hydrolase-like protein with peptidoglycan-binding domain